MSITIQNLNKQFGNFTALNNINLEVNSGELLALLGPSGCGKTSLLRIIGGLDVQNSGKIFFGNYILDGTRNGTRFNLVHTVSCATSVYLIKAHILLSHLFILPHKRVVTHQFARQD